MTEERKQEINDYIQKIIKRIIQKPDNFLDMIDKFREFQTSDAKYTLREVIVRDNVLIDTYRLINHVTRFGNQNGFSEEERAYFRKKLLSRCIEVKKEVYSEMEFLLEYDDWIEDGYEFGRFEFREIYDFVIRRLRYIIHSLRFSTGQIPKDVSINNSSIQNNIIGTFVIALFNSAVYELEVSSSTVSSSPSVDNKTIKDVIREINQEGSPKVKNFLNKSLLLNRLANSLNTIVPEIVEKTLPNLSEKDYNYIENILGEYINKISQSAFEDDVDLDNKDIFNVIESWSTIVKEITKKLKDDFSDFDFNAVNWDELEERRKYNSENELTEEEKVIAKNKAQVAKNTEPIAEAIMKAKTWQQVMKAFEGVDNLTAIQAIKKVLKEGTDENKKLLRKAQLLTQQANSINTVVHEVIKEKMPKLSKDDEDYITESIGNYLNEVLQKAFNDEIDLTDKDLSNVIEDWATNEKDNYASDTKEDAIFQDQIKTLAKEIAKKLKKEFENFDFNIAELDQMEKEEEFANKIKDKDPSEITEEEEKEFDELVGARMAHEAEKKSEAKY